MGPKKVATKFRKDLRALPVPDTDAGRAVAIHLEDHSRGAFETLLSEERRVGSLPQNTTLVQTIQALNDLEVAFVQALVGMKAVEHRVTTYVPELREPFEKSDSCKELEALGADQSNRPARELLARDAAATYSSS